MSTLVNYKKSTCCDCDCDYLDSYDDQPCWGQVDLIDEWYYDDPEYGGDSGWVHACEGHAEYYEGKSYKKFE